jgi:hypothetical protein
LLSATWSDGSGVCVAPCTIVRCAFWMIHREPAGTVMLASVLAAGSLLITDFAF